MPTISDISIIDSNTAEAKSVDSGLQRTICSEDVCGSKTLNVYRRTVLDGRQFEVQTDDDYQLVYVMEASKEGTISFNGETHSADEGAGVLLVPGDSAQFAASGSDLEILHLITPKPLIPLA